MQNNREDKYQRSIEEEKEDIQKAGRRGREKGSFPHALLVAVPCISAAAGHQQSRKSLRAVITRVATRKILRGFFLFLSLLPFCPADYHCLFCFCQRIFFLQTSGIGDEDEPKERKKQLLTFRLRILGLRMNGLWVESGQNMMPVYYPLLALGIWWCLCY